MKWICKTNDVKDRCVQGPLTVRSMSYSVLVCAAKVRIFCVTAMAFRQLYEKKRAKRGGSSGVIFEFRKRDITHNALKINAFFAVK